MKRIDLLTVYLSVVLFGAAFAVGGCGPVGANVDGQTPACADIGEFTPLCRDDRDCSCDRRCYHNGCSVAGTCQAYGPDCGNYQQATCANPTTVIAKWCRDGLGWSQTTNACEICD